MKIHLICCKTTDNAIGFDNKLLFQLKKDMQFFKKTTTDTSNPNLKNAVLMGRNTFLSIPKKYRPLENRINLIVSNNHYESIEEEAEKHSNTYVFNTIDQAIIYSFSNDAVENLYVIGGASLYNYFIENSLFDSMYLTDIITPKNIPSDTFFPTINIENYTIEHVASYIENDVKSLADGSIIPSLKFTINKYSNLIKNTIYKNDEELQYLNILADVLNNGDIRETRNATTISKFGVKMEFNITEYFPLLTTKKVYWKGIVHELLWFINSKTDSKELEKNNVKIWSGNSTRDYLDSIGLNHYDEGTCGPIYGFQWRHFNAEYKGPDEDYTNKGIDQLQNCIDLIKNDPTSRRIFMTAWNPCQLQEMALPPCHVSYQFYVRNGKYIDCQMYQRSGDLFLGVPFNIASTALLTYIIATKTNYIPGKIIIIIGDAHIYSNHIEQVKTQLLRKPYQFPCLKINKQDNIEDYTFDDFNITSYYPHPNIKAQMVA